MTSPQNPQVSVIVPVYNQERYIGRCLRSLLHQTMPLDDYEVIVINDGSTDRTPYALELFHNAIHAITNDENLGLPASVNKGIHAARGNYIVRVDSDDYVNINFLNFLQFYLEQNDYIDAVACDYLLVDDKEEVLTRGNCSETPIACGIMFRKQQLLDIGLYDESFRWHEDRELRIRFEKQFSISRLELPLYRYRRHENNITNDEDSMKLHHENLLKKHGMNADKAYKRGDE